MERRDSWKICSRTLPPFSANRRVPSLAFRGLGFCGGNADVLRLAGLYGAAELRRIRTLSRRRGRAGSGVADSVCGAPDFRRVSPRCLGGQTQSRHSEARLSSGVIRCNDAEHRMDLEHSENTESITYVFSIIRVGSNPTLTARTKSTT